MTTIPCLTLSVSRDALPQPLLGWSGEKVEGEE